MRVIARFPCQNNLNGASTRALYARGNTRPETTRVIDYFTIALTHGLLALAAVMLLSRNELDSEEPKARRSFRNGDGAGEG